MHSSEPAQQMDTGTYGRFTSINDYNALRTSSDDLASFLSAHLSARAIATENAFVRASAANGHGNIRTFHQHQRLQRSADLIRRFGQFLICAFVCKGHSHRKCIRQSQRSRRTREHTDASPASTITTLCGPHPTIWQV